ncbi:MAG: hypothetical protein D6688_00920 [Alphaproteobacteria bacterium]|nr:MAG: hypothetical protein D6688_00920 [Alphaproteobacteria bacterium]
MTLQPEEPRAVRPGRARRGLRAILLGWLCALVAGGVAAEPIGPEGLDRLPASDAVFLGEVHDNPDHHRNQARAVRAILPTAIVFEMVTEAAAARAETLPRSDAAALSRALGWKGGGWPDFELYHPIFLAAPDAHIVGAAAPHALVREAIRKGAAAVFGPDAGRFGLDVALPEDVLAARIKGQREAHCDALPEALLPGMVEAQRLRDAYLARAALGALDRYGPPVAIITGNGHARRDWGAPALLRVAAPSVRVISVGQFEEEAPAAPAFDFWLVTPAADREDPCARLRGGVVSGAGGD